VVTRNDTVGRILDGAVRALARRGLRKLSMSDICDEAAISRGTLYRYFKSKEDVLEAIGQHLTDGFRSDLEEAIAKRPDPDQRVRVVLQVMLDQAQKRPESVEIIEVEPGFALAFFSRHLSEHTEIVRAALEPVVEDLPVIRDGVITQTQLAEIFLRLSYSTFFVRGPQVDKLPKRVGDLWTSLTAGLASKPPLRRARAG
jgi:AcrR family transcriptional regulator